MDVPTFNLLPWWQAILCPIFWLLFTVLQWTIYKLYNLGHMDGNFYELFSVLLSLTLCVSFPAFLLGFYSLHGPYMPVSPHAQTEANRDHDAKAVILGARRPGLTQRCFPPCYFRLLGCGTVESQQWKREILKLSWWSFYLDPLWHRQWHPYRMHAHRSSQDCHQVRAQCVNTCSVSLFSSEVLTPRNPMHPMLKGDLLEYVI